MTNANVIVE